LKTSAIYQGDDYFRLCGAGEQRRIEVAKELLRVLSVTDELAKTSWPDPDLRHCQQDME
jgi:hypothetical protein